MVTLLVATLVGFAADEGESWTSLVDGRTYWIPEGSTDIWIYYGEKNAKDVNIQNTVTRSGLVPVTYNIVKIDERAYQDNDTYETVTIGSGIQIIGKNAFINLPKLQKITFKGACANIDPTAFTSLTALTDLVSEATTPVALTGFDAYYKTVKVTVPKGTKATYKATDGWKEFTTLLEEGETPEPTPDYIDITIQLPNEGWTAPATYTWASGDEILAMTKSFTKGNYTWWDGKVKYNTTFLVKNGANKTEWEYSTIDCNGQTKKTCMIIGDKNPETGKYQASSTTCVTPPTEPYIVSLKVTPSTVQAGSPVAFSTEVANFSGTPEYTYSVKQGAGEYAEVPKIYTPTAAGSYTVKVLAEYNDEVATETAEFTVTAAPITYTYYIAGNGTADNNWCCGAAWQPKACGMASNAYAAKVPAGQYKFKVTNGTWESTWGYAAVDASTSTSGYTNDADGNVNFEVKSEANIAVSFNGTKITLTSDVPFYVPEVEPITVRLQQSSLPKGWGDVAIYYWGGETPTGSWPGDVLTAEDGWYTKTFKSTTTSISIIWNNNDNGKQTVDIADVKASTCYAINGGSGTKHTVKTVDCPAPATEPTITAINITGTKFVGEELTFNATVAGFSSEPAIDYFIKEGEGEYELLDENKYTPENVGEYTIKAYAAYDSEEAEKEVSFTVKEKPADITVKLLASSTSWSEVAVYGFAKGDVKLNGDWPGTKLTAKDGWYIYTYSGQDSLTVIFNNNNNGQQTSDTKVKESTCYSLSGSATPFSLAKRSCESIYDTWTIVGDSVLVGKNWAPAFTDNDMTYDPVDSKYKLTIEGVTLNAQSYEYKAAKDHAWATTVPSGANAKIEIAAAGVYDVAYTLDAAKGTINAVATAAPGEPTVTAIDIAGKKYVGEELTFTATTAGFSAEPTIEYSIKVGKDGEYTPIEGNKYTPDAIERYTVKAVATNDTEVAEKEFAFYVTEAPEDITVKLLARSVSWESASVYAFDSKSGDELLGAWPGTAVALKDGWYAQTFSGVDSVTVVFNNGILASIRQTVNIPTGEEKAVCVKAKKTDSPYDVALIACEYDSIDVAIKLPATWDEPAVFDWAGKGVGSVSKMTKSAAEAGEGLAWWEGKVDSFSDGFLFKNKADDETWDLQTSDVAVPEEETCYELGAEAEGLFAVKVTDCPEEPSTDPAVTAINIEGTKYVGEELTFTATTKNFSGEPAIVYSVKLGEGEYEALAGNTYTPTATGDYTVKAAATYKPEVGEEESASKEVAFTVTEKPVVNYFAKNMWDGTEWTWKQLSKQSEGDLYELVKVVYGGTGININTKEEDKDAIWVPEASFAGDKVQAKDTVSFTFNPADSIITMTLIARPAPTQDTWTIAGDEELMGSNWDPKDTNNDMKINKDMVSYSLTIDAVDLEAQDYEYKAVKDHSWDGAQVPQQGNQTLTIDKAGAYKVEFYLVPGVGSLFAQATLLPPPTAAEEAEANAKPLVYKIIENGEVIIVTPQGKFSLLGVKK